MRSKLLECLACELIQLLSESRIGGTVGKLRAQLWSREPARAAFVGHDVGYWLAVHGEDHALARSDGIDHLACVVA